MAILVALLTASADLATSGGAAARSGPGDAIASFEAEQSGLFAQVAPSVVLIYGEGTSGSGFVVGPDGLVLTNAHVVGEGAEVAVQLFDGRYGRGRVIARATGALDLALVRIPFADVPPIPVGEPGAVRAGMYAATVGHGGGAAWSLSTGLVANPRPLGDGAPLLLAQMALRPGSSGGPLVDRRGRVVAVVTAGTRDASGVTFGIRIEAAAEAFPQLAAWKMPVPVLPAVAAPEPPVDPPAAAPSAEKVAVAMAEDGGAVVDVSRLASVRAREAAYAVEPSPATMVTVWEAPRAARRLAARTVPIQAAVPSHPAITPAHGGESAGDARGPRDAFPLLPLLFALAAGAAATAVAVVAARRRSR